MLLVGKNFSTLDNISFTILYRGNPILKPECLNSVILVLSLQASVNVNSKAYAQHNFPFLKSEMLDYNCANVAVWLGLGTYTYG